MTNMLIASEDYEICYSQPDDAPFLKGWIQDPNMLQWYPASSEQDIEFFVRNWIGFSRYQASLTALYKGQPIGIATLFLMPYLKVAHTSMTYMLVDPAYQRRGVGSSLLKNIVHHAKARFRLEFTYLEVYEGSPILPLLNKSDFYEVFRQENFVRQGELSRARIIMEKQLIA